ncbi:MAG: DUF4430 domain-containing protein [Parcubacteria group bacterium]
MNKKYILSIIILVLAAVVLYIALDARSIAEDTSNGDVSMNGETLDATLHIDGISYDASMSLGDTVIDLMTNVAENEDDFKFTGTEYEGMGFFVESINGISSTNDMYWIYYINDKSAQVGASQYELVDGDVIEWKFEESDF